MPEHTLPEILSKRSPQKRTALLTEFIQDKKSIAELNSIPRSLEKLIQRTQDELEQIDMDIALLQKEQEEQTQREQTQEKARTWKNPTTWMNKTKQEMDQSLDPKEIERQVFAQQGFDLEGPEEQLSNKHRDREEKLQLLENALSFKNQLAALTYPRKSELYEQTLEAALNGDKKAYEAWVSLYSQLDAQQGKNAIRILDTFINEPNNEHKGTAYFLKAMIYSKHSPSLSNKETQAVVNNLLEAASNLDYAAAANQLAERYELGVLGLEKNPEKAFYYYQKAISLDKKYINEEFEVTSQHLKKPEAPQKPELPVAPKKQEVSSVVPEVPKKPEAAVPEVPKKQVELSEVREEPDPLLQALDSFYDKVQQLPEFNKSKSLQAQVETFYIQAKNICHETRNTNNSSETLHSTAGEKILKLASQTLTHQTNSDKIFRLLANIVLVPLKIISPSAAEKLANTMAFQAVKNRYQQILEKVLPTNQNEEKIKDAENESPHLNRP